MPDFCDECHEAKDDLCPKCNEEFVCGRCEETCLGCYLNPDAGGDEDEGPFAGDDDAG
jgi:hypothetical protein